MELGHSFPKRSDIDLSADIVTSLIDKDWDWNEILRRKDIFFTEEHIPNLVNIDLNWKEFSRRDDFFPTLSVLNILKDKDLGLEGHFQKNGVGLQRYCVV